jgi:hypothetical protein
LAVSLTPSARLRSVGGPRFQFLAVPSLWLATYPSRVSQFGAATSANYRLSFFGKLCCRGATAPIGTESAASQSRARLAACYAPAPLPPDSRQGMAVGPIVPGLSPAASGAPRRCCGHWGSKSTLAARADPGRARSGQGRQQNRLDRRDCQHRPKSPEGRTFDRSISLAAGKRLQAGNGGTDHGDGRIR